MKEIIIKTCDKIMDIMSTVAGWIGACAILLLNLLLEYVSGHELNIAVVIFVVVMDAAWGIYRAVKDNKYTRSALMRESVAKLAVYGTVILAFIGFDKIAGWEGNFGCNMVSALIVLVEVWSIIGNILIVYPDFPLLCLLKKAMAGEIASKLNIDPEEVEKTLKSKKKKKQL